MEIDILSIVKELAKRHATKGTLEFETGNDPPLKVTVDIIIKGIQPIENEMEVKDNA